MKTAIYTRISSDPTCRELGVRRQTDDCTALAELLGWDIVATWTDNDLSAFNGKLRPGFEAMLTAMAKREFGALICWHPDRLYRSLKDLQRLIETAQPAGVSIKTVQGGDIDLSNATGRMLATVVGSVSQMESEHKSERHVRAYMQKAEAGTWQTSNRPFGYTMTGVPLEPEATMIRTAVADVLSGKSIRSVATDWNAAGVTTTRGTAWSGPRVRRVLMNPRYAALKVHQDKVVGPGDWKPIIDENTHRGLVAFLSDESRKSRVSWERRFIGAGVFLCGQCGAPMRTAYPNGGKRVYVCSASNHVARQAAPVDAYVEFHVFEMLTGSDIHRRIGAVNSIDAEALHSSRAALGARLEALAGMFASGDIDAAQLRRGTTDLRTELAGVDAVLAEATATSPTARLLEAASSVEEAWEACSPDLRGKIISELLTVRVLKAPRGSKGFHPEYIDIKPKV
jgi:site-specific DNA recombinase